MPKLLQKVYLGAVMAVLVTTSANADQLPRRGSYAGKYTWTEQAKATEVDKGWMFTDAINQGVFINASGSGFLHGATVVCTSQGVIQDDQFRFSGNCAATDKDGDKAALKWACAKAGNRCAGSFEWISGTGKYVGLRGQSQFDGGVVGQGPLGPIEDSNWKGEWSLP